MAIATPKSKVFEKTFCTNICTKTEQYKNVQKRIFANVPSLSSPCPETGLKPVSENLYLFSVINSLIGVTIINRPISALLVAIFCLVKPHQRPGNGAIPGNLNLPIVGHFNALYSIDLFSHAFRLLPGLACPLILVYRFIFALYARNFPGVYLYLPGSVSGLVGACGGNFCPISKIEAWFLFQFLKKSKKRRQPGHDPRQPSHLIRLDY